MRLASFALVASSLLFGCQDNTAPAGTCLNPGEFAISGCAAISGTITGFTPNFAPTPPSTSLFIIADQVEGGALAVHQGSGQLAEGHYSIAVVDFTAHPPQPESTTMVVRWYAYQDNVLFATDSARVHVTFVPPGAMVIPASLDVSINLP